LGGDQRRAEASKAMSLASWLPWGAKRVDERS